MCRFRTLASLSINSGYVIYICKDLSGAGPFGRIMYIPCTVLSDAPDFFLTNAKH